MKIIFIFIFLNLPVFCRPPHNFNPSWKGAVMLCADKVEPLLVFRVQFTGSSRQAWSGHIYGSSMAVEHVWIKHGRGTYMDQAWPWNMYGSSMVVAHIWIKHGRGTCMDQAWPWNMYGSSMAVEHIWINHGRGTNVKT